MSPTHLSRQITDFVTGRVEAIVTRFLPDFTIPGFFCGHKRTGFAEGPDLIYTLGHLHDLGVSEIAGTPIDNAISKLLRCVDGAATDTFYSYFLADTLLAFGPFADNPLLAGFTNAERENVRIATDSTNIYDPEKQSLRGQPNNYWGVLAYCEFLRQRLGILDDDSILQTSLAHLRRLIFFNPAGFFDDDRDGSGRYDIYSADVHLFCEPMWHLLDAERLDFNLRQHVRLLEKIAMENGASWVFGRSIGALSICLATELGSMSLERGLAADPARSLALVAHSFEAIQGWFEDDLINAHRHGNTEGYRGIHRVLQMTLNCLGKLCYAAKKLRNLPAPSGEPKTPLFPAIDDFTPFDNRNAGLWMFRNEHLAFQLPLIDGWNSDYNAWPRSPGVFENPVESRMYCGAPRIAVGPDEYTPAGLPVHISKSPGALTATYETLRCTGGPKHPEPLPGQYTVTWLVDGGALHIDGQLTLEQVPDGVSLFIPETDRPLNVAVKSDHPFHHDTIAVSGMADWRSAWSEPKSAHQIHFAPARELRFSFTLTPKLRVRSIPADDHDYTRSLFDSMPAAWIEKRPRPVGVGMELAALTDNIEILHVGWPEWAFGSPATDIEKFDAQYLEFIEALGRSRVRIVWTMHNRRPHTWDPERGRNLYRAWARIADGVIHHSQWGMNLMRSELPFREDARHVVIPHGHFGEQMPVTKSRAEIEAALGLPPAPMRFGLMGRWQKEKQVELIIAAFQQAARPDQQLVLTAYKPGMEKPADPRIFYLPRNDWMLREEIAGHIHLCDALVSAHTGDTYLTSGVSADAIGAGLAMFVPHWDYFHETLGDAPFYHDNTQDSLAASFASITAADIVRGKSAFRALQPTCSWPLVAEKTLALYRTLGRK